MSTTACPNGHMSADPDWCDTCGARLSADPDSRLSTASAPVPSAAPPPAPTVVSAAPAAPSAPCPHCGAANVPDALFCEDCGYDFTTGQAPDPVPTGTVPVVAGSLPGAGSAALAPATPAGAPGAQPPGRSAIAAPVPAAAPSPGPPGWIVIVEVDPVWFDLKGTLADRPCPPPSSSTIPLGSAIVHIGRSSQSRGIHPEIAMDSDTAVSRQHAQLIATSTGGAPASAIAGAGGADAEGADPDGAVADRAADDAAAPAPDAFAAVDLGSTNGTFVVRAGSEPDASIEPIAPGVPVTLADGDRVYIGAWSRLTIRHTGA